MALRGFVRDHSASGGASCVRRCVDCVGTEEDDEAPATHCCDTCGGKALCDTHAIQHKNSKKPQHTISVVNAFPGEFFS